jgi:3',5'-cyclic AMP phosphodiesterase CpdA
MTRGFLPFRLAAASLFFTCLVFAQNPPLFIEKPYLQLGDAPQLTTPETMMLLWHTAEPGAWSVEVRTSRSKTWQAMAAPAFQTVAAIAAVTAPPAQAIPQHYVYRARLTGLTPGEEFQYRVLNAGTTAFAASGKARKAVGQPVRFALFGDCSQNTPGQRAIAYQASLGKPDFVFITGDIVYSSGRISEYRDKFFPIYNADTAGNESGAPLLRSVPFLAAPGNHDTLTQNFTRFPDALAYFLYWDQPLNGPAPFLAPKTSHQLMGNEPSQPAFRAAATPRYPVMANYSFDYGNAHWTVLDSNPYMDWNNPALRAWLEKDLAAARSATWRFVAFHHPGFNSSKSHFTDQWMRSLSPVFEKGKVDVVFAGHVHNYQRSFPLTFAPKPQADGSIAGPKGEVDGTWTLDKDFMNGASRQPKGVIYIVSGGGGAALYDPAQMHEPATWQAFTDKFISDVHTFSQVEINGRTFVLKQISETGKELDSFRIAK